MNFRVIFAILLIAVISAMSMSAVYAQDQSADQTEVLSKLNQVLTNQKVIMEQIASIKEELNVVKIRVTQSQ